MTNEALSTPSNFILEAVAEDLRTGRFDHVQTRFPPEPNGYLHIGHAKALCIDFGVAEVFNGVCNLRFDDTNPVTEETAYVDSIKEDIRWLGFAWANEFYASDGFCTHGNAHLAEGAVIGDIIECHVCLYKASPDYSKWGFRHDLIKSDGTLTATVFSDGAFMDIDMRKLTNLPDEFIEKMDTVSKSDNFHWIEKSQKTQN